MRHFLIFISVIILLFTSCSAESSLEERDIYLISVADDFQSSTNNKLKTVVTDQAALISQFETFHNIHIYSFVSQHGRRYVSVPTDDNKEKRPRFVPVDSSCSTLSSPDDSSFDHFEYKPDAGENEVDWTMDTVLDEVRSLHTGEDDLIIFAYSGHGDSSGALLTNAERTPYETTNREMIIEAFSSLSGNKIFFLDSCYSSNFIAETTLSTTDSFVSDEDRYKGEDYISGIKNSTLTHTVDTQTKLWIMASAGRNQKANDSGDSGDSAVQRCYGEFTYYLLKALGYNMDKNESERKDSSLTFYSIYSYIMKNFPSSDKENQTPRSSLKRLDIRLR